MQAAPEVADLQSVLEELACKVEELQEAVRTSASTKDALRAAFAQIAGLTGAAGQATGTPLWPRPACVKHCMMMPLTLGHTAYEVTGCRPLLPLPQNCHPSLTNNP